MPGVRFLVVSDDLGLAEMLRAQAENMGWSSSVLDEAPGDGAPFLAADVVAVDMQLGEGDLGVPTIARVRAVHETANVLAIASDDDAARRATAAGAQHVVTEPFTIAQLIEALRDAARGTPLPDGVIDIRGMVGATGESEPPWWATR